MGPEGLADDLLHRLLLLAGPPTKDLVLSLRDAGLNKLHASYNMDMIYEVSPTELSPRRGFAPHPCWVPAAPAAPPEGLGPGSERTRGRRQSCATPPASV